jgi:hypothetical protein
MSPGYPYFPSFSLSLSQDCPNFISGSWFATRCMPVPDPRVSPGSFPKCQPENFKSTQAQARRGADRPVPPRGGLMMIVTMEAGIGYRRGAG